MDGEVHRTTKNDFPRSLCNDFPPLTIPNGENWQAKNEGVRMEESELYVKSVMVDGGRQLKRLRPAPQGRGNRIRKRSNHVTLVVDSKISETKN